MDHADPRKDDRYKGFAAGASAEVLFKLLVQCLPSRTDTMGYPAAAARVKSVYVIGGVTDETEYPDFERTKLGDSCRQLGEAIARSGADLIVCSPFPDSADHHAILGYLRAGVGSAIHLHSPRHESVAQKQSEMLAMLGHDGSQIRNWHYPGPETDAGWGQAWLFCQLRALEHADVLISIGGRVSHTANTLLHLAEAHQVPVVPFPFLGGASKRAYERRDWGRLYPELDYESLRHDRSVADVMAFADHLATARIRGSRSYNWPPAAVFISRARADAEYAARLATYLRSAGRTAILGDEQVQDHRAIEPTIGEALLACDLAVVLWSASYALSPFCNDELESALLRSSLGEMRLWVFNLDGTEIIPRGARSLPQAVTRTPDALVAVARELLDDASHR
jgi:hypothetical protein